MLPDQIHIDHLSRALWCGREVGHAAVMVGSGFSRNAERLSSSAARMPTWDDLTAGMASALYGAARPDAEGGGQAPSVRQLPGGTGALRLATEYELVFGRPALDALILSSVPDLQYRPGPLHTLLLSLPWSDVFTTNYDTLLERTRPTVHDRRYDLIQTAADLPGRIKPRIVKLHGSFPSHRPFIATEEDFRTFPRQFPPYVNLVQQSLMENALVLIGFSGDDPNFLYWTGWVRDNLGSATPPIYLCGLLNLAPPQRRVLESRHVIPIDLSPLFPAEAGMRAGSRHARALEWFLLALKRSRPADRITWPAYAPPGLGAVRPQLPPVPAASEDRCQPGPLDPHEPVLSPGTMHELLRSWQAARRKYPGWMVCPTENRDELWTYTDFWIEPIMRSVDALPAPANLGLLFELNWRLETCLVPLFLPWVEVIRRVLATFDPFPDLAPDGQAPFRPGDSGCAGWDWTEIQEQWVSLHFALARESREDQDQPRFQQHMDRLAAVVGLRPEWQARWCHEEACVALFPLDPARLTAAAAAWPLETDLPFWQIRKAAILAETGVLEDARRTAEAALDAIRSQVLPFERDYSLASQEGWAMLLLQFLDYAELGRTEQVATEYGPQWERLRAYRANPWDEIETLRAFLQFGPPPSLAARRTTRASFDPGRVVTEYSGTGGTGLDTVRPAFAFLRLFEEGAVPVRCRHVDVLSKELVNAAKWVAESAPFWAVRTVMRTNQPRHLEEWFDRTHVASLGHDEVDALGALLLASLDNALSAVQNRPADPLAPLGADPYQVEATAELLSRACFRFSPARLDQLLGLAARIYSLPFNRGSFQYARSCNALFERLLFALSPAEIIDRMGTLLALPIPGDAGFEVREPYQWKEPFLFIHWPEEIRAAPSTREAWSEQILRLLRLVREGSPEARKRAVERLDVLTGIGALGDEEKQALGEALWARVDVGTGLPRDTYYRASAFLTMPDSPPGVADRSVRTYLASTELPPLLPYSVSDDGKLHVSNQFEREFENLVACWLGATVPLVFREGCCEERFIDWSSDEAAGLLRRIAARWEEAKECMERPDFPPIRRTSGVLDDRARGAVRLLARVVLPACAAGDQDTARAAADLLKDMRSKGVCVAEGLHGILFVAPDEADGISALLRNALDAREVAPVSDGIRGVFQWLVWASRQRLPAVPDDLLDALVERVVSSREPVLALAVKQSAIITHRFPAALSPERALRLCRGLEYLIHDTELPSDETADADAVSGRLDVPARPAIRSAAAELAYRLHGWYADRGLDEPEVLSRWRAASGTDPLPEVRHAWP